MYFTTLDYALAYLFFGLVPKFSINFEEILLFGNSEEKNKISDCSINYYLLLYYY